jgi:hypothetical protein
LAYRRGHRGMARSGDWRAWRSTDLFGNSHRDRAYASPGVPPAAASDGRTAAIDRGSARHRYCNSRPHDIEPPRRRVDHSTKVDLSWRTNTSPHRQYWSEDLWRGCVKKTRERHAMRKMKEGPSEPPCRRRLQTAMSCFGRKAAVVNVMVKRRDQIASCEVQGDERK